MIAVFLVILGAVLTVAALIAVTCWLIDRPDTGRRAKPLSIEDQRTLRWARSLNRKNVSRARRPQSECSDGQLAAPAPAVPTSATSPGPGHHHAHGAGWDELAANPDGSGPVRSAEACEPCTVHGCKPGCNCACHWDELHARADAWYGAPEIDAALIARADAVLAGAL